MRRFKSELIEQLCDVSTELYERNFLKKIVLSKPEAVDEIKSVITVKSIKGANVLQIETFSKDNKVYHRNIRDNIRITLTTKEIAENLFVSVSLLRRTFQKELGRTIGEYVDEMVFSEAKKLLSDSFVSVTEVSRRLCFGSRTYFTQRFKEIYGMTPTEYRRIALVLTE